MHKRRTSLSAVPTCSAPSAVVRAAKIYIVKGPVSPTPGPVNGVETGGSLGLLAAPAVRLPSAFTAGRTAAKQIASEAPQCIRLLARLPV
mmetsp:Transcript_20197/g.60921  ORF Transcript_20197/g.60921 Transcript_20197/m.60921 type:complete len:90 (+) Transcript_20197:393-662(+)